jgi:membrane-bound lytic murein transglycosylase A
VRPAEAETPADRVVPLTALRGWEAEDHAAALAAYRETCGAARDPALAQICREARAIGPLDRDQSKRFFEAHFRAEQTHGEGVLTAYFAPEYPARHRADDEFTAPVRPKPADLGDTTQTPYLDRTALEAQPAGKPLAWMRPEDLFFLQIQGSGVLTFDDGKRMKALYAGNNGRPFVGVANPMRDKGLLAPDNVSADSIRAWLAAHRGPDADAIMRLNPRYAFFSLGVEDGRPPVGSANVPLAGGRSLAIDPAWHQMGELYWVDANAPILNGAFPTYRRLAMALDTGGAIKGDVRADLFMGQGQAAGAEAGRVRHTLRLYRLVPKDAAP